MRLERRNWPVWMGLAALAMVALSASVRAMFVMPQLEEVPIDRIVANLTQHAKDNPRDVETWLNLGRVHAMAYAYKKGTVGVVIAGRGTGPFTSGQPYFGFQPGFQGVKVKPAESAEALNAAKAHLPQAIAAYEAALRIDPQNAVAKLGRVWCLDQSGDRVPAIAGYRDVIADAWAKEGAGQLPNLQNVRPTTAEVAEYLIPLLDPVRDANEITTLRQQIAQVTAAMRTRPVTPIAIPLREGLSAADLIDRSASVAFDLDGSGLKRRWTWITPDAGWLVYDRHHRGEITSALQLFGNVTFWMFWENGYHALSALDDNGDGELSGPELEGFAIWRDANGNGVADPGEVRPLSDWGIVRLSCAHELLDDPDAVAFSPEGVTFASGATRPTFDLLMYRR